MHKIRRPKRTFDSYYSNKMVDEKLMEAPPDEPGETRATGTADDSPESTGGVRVPAVSKQKIGVKLAVDKDRSIR